jgi:hypothetical protein
MCRWVPWHTVGVIGSCNPWPFQHALVVKGRDVVKHMVLSRTCYMHAIHFVRPGAFSPLWSCLEAVVMRALESNTAANQIATSDLQSCYLGCDS